VYHVRARTTQATGTFAWGKLNFYARWSTTNYLLGSAIISTNTVAESDDWQDVFIYLENNASDGNRMLSNADLDNLDLVIEFDSGGTQVSEMLAPDGDGTHTEWADAVDGDVAAFSDCSSNPFLVGGHELEDVKNFIKSSTSGERQSFTFTPTNTYTSIVDVSLFAHWASDKESVPLIGYRYWDSGATEYSLEERGGDTNHTTGGVSIPLGQFTKSDYRNNQGLNPADSLAWANADITGGEFGFEMENSVKAVLQGVSLQITGEVSGGTDIEIDTVSAQVMGVTTSNPGSGLIDWTRLWSTNQGHYRLDHDVIDPTVTDVTNSVPLNSTGIGWPVNSAVLYGQVYLVNGVDPTVYYPNGSNVFAELATNDGGSANPLTGRCVAAFGSRIHYGWTKDNATITPERLTYSQWQNGQVHNHASAGDIDIIDTPGGITALVPLDEDRMALLKEVGVYTIRATGKSAFPFLRDLIDGATGCTAPKTALRTNLPDGQSQVFFLGENETWGWNVYAFNGAAVVPIGNAIARELRETMKKRAVNITAHAAIDPQTNSYWLFVPENDDTWPRRAWVMDLTTGITGYWWRAQTSHW
jgi:hypothetical protein